MDNNIVDTNVRWVFTRLGLLYYKKWGNEEKYFVFNWENINEIWETDYLTAKFWNNYKKIISQLEDKEEYCIHTKWNSFVCCWFRSFYFQWFDKNGNLQKKNSDIGFDSIYSFDIDEDGNIWYAIPTAHYVWKHSISQNKEITNIWNRYQSGNPLSYPEDVIIYGKHLYISDMGSKRVLRFNIMNNKLDLYKTFSKPVWLYRQIKWVEVVLLDGSLVVI